MSDEPKPLIRNRTLWRLLPLFFALAVVLVVAAATTTTSHAATLGDVDCDNDADAVDALQILRDVGGLGTSAGCLADAADTDCDGDRDSVDALRILQTVVGQQVSVPPGCGAIGTDISNSPLVLNEVLFAPGAGDDPFVELKTTSGGADPSGMLLVNERDDQFVIPNVGAITGEEVLLLEFGGSDFLDDESGFVELRDGEELLDRVVWGEDQPAGVKLTAGGFLVGFEPGTTIGRVPGSRDLNLREWVAYSPSQATPGAPNPAAGVQVALPLDGAVFESGDVKLNWYPVPRASEYRVEVASEDTFSDPHTEQTVATSSLQLSALPAGEHFWRVQVIDDGDAGEYSPVQSFTIEGASPAAAVADEEEDVPGVPFIVPRKDTAMLLLEKNAPAGDFAWDAAHPDIDPNDNREVNNAFLASVAMVNGFLGGNLSQDRMGYEAFKGRAVGAERDLAYGDALSKEKGIGVMLLAFGGVDEMCGTNTTEIWNFLQESLAMGFPPIGAISSHAVVVTGSRIVTPGGDGPVADERFVSVSDPYVGQYDVNFDDQVFPCLWRPAAGTIIGAFDDAGIASDSDGDGVVDFDEVERFGTDPNNPDTDQDGLNDKEDIAESVFEPGIGYASDFAFVGDEFLGLPPHGRDWDRDGLSKELDCDNDNDGVKDGDDPDNWSNPPVVSEPVPCGLPGTGTRYVGEATRTQTTTLSSGKILTLTAHATDVVFALDPSFNQPPSERFETTAGTVTYTVSGFTHLNGEDCPVDGSGETSLSPGDGSLFVHPGGLPPNYTAFSNPFVEYSAVAHCPGGDVDQNYIGGAWISITGPFPFDDVNLLEGSLDAGATDFEWSFTRVD